MSSSFYSLKVASEREATTASFLVLSRKDNGSPWWSPFRALLDWLLLSVVIHFLIIYESVRLASLGAGDEHNSLMQGRISCRFRRTTLLSLPSMHDPGVICTQQPARKLSNITQDDSRLFISLVITVQVEPLVAFLGSRHMASSLASTPLSKKSQKCALHQASSNA